MRLGRAVPQPLNRLEQQPAVAERDAEVLQVLIGQLGQDRGRDVVVEERLGVALQPQFLQPSRDVQGLSPVELASAEPAARKVPEPTGSGQPPRAQPRSRAPIRSGSRGSQARPASFSAAVHIPTRSGTIAWRPVAERST